MGPVRGHIYRMPIDREKSQAPGRIQTHNLLITIHSVIVLQVLPITFLVNFYYRDTVFRYYAKLTIEN